MPYYVSRHFPGSQGSLLMGIPGSLGLKEARAPHGAAFTWPHNLGMAEHFC